MEVFRPSNVTVAMQAVHVDLVRVCVALSCHLQYTSKVYLTCHLNVMIKLRCNVQCTVNVHVPCTVGMDWGWPSDWPFQLVRLCAKFLFSYSKLIASKLLTLFIQRTAFGIYLMSFSPAKKSFYLLKNYRLRQWSLSLRQPFTSSSACSFVT